MLFDTDGDGLSDGLEIATGSDPLDPASYDLAAALVSISVRPASFVLNSNTVLPGEARVDLVVEGTLLDGTSLDLSSASRGTSYTSSDLLVCNFGLEEGVVFAGQEGACTITVGNSGFEAVAEGLVQEFTPFAVSELTSAVLRQQRRRPGRLGLRGRGPGGLHVIDVMSRRRPTLTTSLSLPGNANDIVVEGTLASRRALPGFISWTDGAGGSQPGRDGRHARRRDRASAGRRGSLRRRWRQGTPGDLGRRSERGVDRRCVGYRGDRQRAGRGRRGGGRLDLRLRRDGDRRY